MVVISFESYNEDELEMKVGCLIISSTANLFMFMRCRRRQSVQAPPCNPPAAGLSNLEEVMVDTADSVLDTRPDPPVSDPAGLRIRQPSNRGSETSGGPASSGRASYGLWPAHHQHETS